MKRLIGALAEELVLSFRVFEDFQRRDPKDLHDQIKLLHFTFAWKDWNSRVKLNENATKTPHVDPSRVGDSDDNLGRSVEARLDVGVDALV